MENVGYDAAASAPADMDEAERFLVMGEFSKAVELCRVRLDDLKKRRLEDHSEDEGDEDTQEISGLDTESLCIIAMQALAEQDEWKQVLAFLVEHAYTSIPALTPKLIQLCICLYGKVQAFRTAEDVVYQWLDNSTNMRNSDKVVELFILLILVPQDKYQEALALINNSSALSLEKRSEGVVFINSLMENAERMEHCTGEDDESEKTERLDELTAKIDTGTKKPKASNDHNRLAYLFSSFVRRFSLLVSRYIPVLGVLNRQSLYSILKKLALIGIFAFLIIQANLDITSSLQHLLTLGHGIVKIWRSMFSPYHVAALQ